MQTNPSPLKRLSLKNRLLFAAALWLITMLLAAGYFIPQVVHRYLVEEVQQQLERSFDEITANLTVNESGMLGLSHRLSDPRFYQPYSGLYWTAATTNQELRSRSLWDQPLTHAEKGITHIVKGARDEPLITLNRSIYLADYPYPIQIVVGEDESPVTNTLQQINQQLWLILGLLFIGILILIAVQVSWSLWPLAKMHRELQALRSGEQSSLDGLYPKEVTPLIHDLNALLFHYQELLKRARHHAGNLSHSLKTPLSVLNNQANQLPQEQRELLQKPIAQIQQQIDYHLSRARMAGAANILAVKTSPSARIDAIAQAFDKVYFQRELTLVNELDSDLMLAVDPNDFDEMMGNLLENSYKWAHSLIRVYSQAPSSSLINICLEDDGPGIDRSQLDSVLKRGIRLDETQPGTGLGLSIANDIAHSYQGQLTLEEGALGGLKATLTLRKAIN